MKVTEIEVHSYGLENKNSREKTFNLKTALTHSMLVNEIFVFSFWWMHRV